MPEVELLYCTQCDSAPTIVRINSVAKIVCHCTDADGGLEPVDVNDFAMLPEPWEFM